MEKNPFMTFDLIMIFALSPLTSPPWGTAAFGPAPKN